MVKVSVMVLHLHAINKQCVSFPLLSVILTTDAQPTALPDTYVVPVRGNATFTCSSSGGDLFWRLNVTGPMGYSRIGSDTEGLKDRPGFSVSDESTVDTTSFTLHNISLESNPSPVECRDLNIEDVSQNRAVLMIIVEGEFSIRMYIVHWSQNEVNYSCLFTLRTLSVYNLGRCIHAFVRHVFIRM